MLGNILDSLCNFTLLPPINKFNRNTTQTQSKLALNKIKYIYKIIIQKFVLVITDSSYSNYEIYLLLQLLILRPHWRTLISTKILDFLTSAPASSTSPLPPSRHCCPVAPSLYLCLFNFCPNLLLLRPIYNTSQQFVN